MTRSRLTETGLLTLLTFGTLAVLPAHALADVPRAEAKTEPAAATDNAPAPADTTTGAWTGHRLLLAQYAPGYGYPQQAPPPPPGYQPAPPVYQQVPPGYYVAPPPPAYGRPRVIVGYEERPRYGVLFGGLGMFLAGYVPTALVGVALGDESNTGGRSFFGLLVPVIGPLFYFNPSNHGNIAEDRALNGTANFFLAFDFLVQAGGLAMMLVGGLTRKRVPIYERFSVVPTATPTMLGLAATGRF